jgi:hypothetical protein
MNLKYFLYSFIFVSAAVSVFYCEFFGASGLNEIIPSVRAFKNGTIYKCEAASVWVQAWYFMALYYLLAAKLAMNSSRPEQDVFYLYFWLFFLTLLVCWFGLDFDGVNNHWTRTYMNSKFWVWFVSVVFICANVVAFEGLVSSIKWRLKKMGTEKKAKKREAEKGGRFI